METTRSIRKALSPGNLVTSINLKDAYFHVLVHPDFRKYLRVAVGGKVYQFRALPFGLSPAPREFCRVTGVLGTLLHRLTIYLHLYLDDWLLRATSRAICWAHTQIALEKAPPDCSLSPSAVRGSQLGSQHHSLQTATSSALPHHTVVHGITTIVFPSETQ